MADKTGKYIQLMKAARHLPFYTATRTVFEETNFFSAFLQVTSDNQATIYFLVQQFQCGDGQSSQEAAYLSTLFPFLNCYLQLQLCFTSIHTSQTGE